MLVYKWYVAFNSVYLASLAKYYRRTHSRERSEIFLAVNSTQILSDDEGGKHYQGYITCWRIHKGNKL